jgi:aspartate aminotransferase
LSGNKDYIIFIDGISKCFAATGVRGAGLYPKPVIDKMNSIMSHIAPGSKPEQIGLGRFCRKR